MVKGANLDNHNSAAFDLEIQEDAKCQTKILRHIETSKDAFQKLNKLLINKKEKSMNCYGKLIILYGYECWTISS